MRRWIIGGLVIAFFVALYLLKSYNDIFERHTAYLYNPESDDVYVIRLAPSLSKSREWDGLIPFKPLCYTEPDGAEYIGKLHGKITESQADPDLLKNDPDAWREKQHREIDNLRGFKTKKFEFLDVEYFYRPIQNASVYMSKTLTRIFKPHEIEPNEILVVDAVIARRTVLIQSNSVAKPVSLIIVRKALLFKGFAAYVLSGHLTGFPPALHSGR